MPIKFACEHCQKRLVVGSRMAGTAAACPSCGKPIRVPDAPVEEPIATRANEPALASSSAAAMFTSAPATASTTAVLPRQIGVSTRRFEEFVVYDDDFHDSEVAYDDDPAIPPAPLAKHVTIPRSVIYVQGALIGVVAVVAFLLGMMAGGVFHGPDSASTAAAPFTMSGRIEYRSASGRMRPDEGAVVVLLPQNSRPEAGAKWPADGLRPEDPVPGVEDASIRAIQEIGGDYARTDLEGNYELHGADRGDYFVLVISRRGHRSDNDPPRRSDVAQIGRYFTPTLDLLSQKQYRWFAVNIGEDETRNVTFE